ncbi:transmembrane and ubiquitin-like domain-containing protein 1 [Platysternon megacephalum]|uniref:Transmembrane and ubiquitin-like domain-containing protein 1 n=1 Tax=Platysternon megacephalum TaxID=55544 RepID=A0A4D9DQP4_9SAUR|nr:transmembrane and ubiquitin-like domain-containing protein 1 [Platysternon megacephalum]
MRGPPLLLERANPQESALSRDFAKQHPAPLLCLPVLGSKAPGGEPGCRVRMGRCCRVDAWPGWQRWEGNGHITQRNHLEPSLGWGEAPSPKVMGAVSGAQAVMAFGTAVTRSPRLLSLVIRVTNLEPFLPQVFVLFGGCIR